MTVDEIRRLPHDDPKLVRLLAEEEKTVEAARQKTARRENRHNHHGNSHDLSPRHLNDNKTMSIVPSGKPLSSQHVGNDDDDEDDDALAVRSNDHGILAIEDSDKEQNKVAKHKHGKAAKAQAQHNEHGDEDDEVSLPLVGCGTWKAAISTVTAASVPSSLDGLIDKQQRQERIKKLQMRGSRFLSAAERLALETPPTRLTLLRDNMLKLIGRINEAVKETQEEWYVNSPCQHLNCHMIFKTYLTSSTLFCPSL